MLSSICRGKAAAGIFLLKPRSKTSGNGGYITGVFWAAANTAYTKYIFLRFQKFRDFMMIYNAWALLRIIVALGHRVLSGTDRC